MGRRGAVTGAVLAERARRLLADVREQDAAEAIRRRRLEAGDRWYAQCLLYGCEHRLLAGPDQTDGPVDTELREAGGVVTVQAFRVALGPPDEPAPFPTYLANLERAVMAHAAWHEAEHVAVVPRVGWRHADEPWQTPEGS